MIAIQKDGKLLVGFSGTIPCLKVVIIDGKVLNIVTKPADPERTIRLYAHGDEPTRYEYKGKEISVDEYGSLMERFRNEDQQRRIENNTK